MYDLSEAAIDLAFEAGEHAIDGLEVTFTNRPAALELERAGLAQFDVGLCGDPCRCESDVIRLTEAGAAALSHLADA